MKVGRREGRERDLQKMQKDLNVITKKSEGRSELNKIKKRVKNKSGYLNGKFNKFQLVSATNMTLFYLMPVFMSRSVSTLTAMLGF